MSKEELRIAELLARQAESVNVLEDKWIASWAALAEKHYKSEENESIRVLVVDSIRQLFNKYHVIYEDELMNKIILPNFNDVDLETSGPLRRSIIKLLNDICTNCISCKHCNAVSAILRRMLTRPFKQPTEELNNRVLVDSRSIVKNLNRLFMAKLHRLPIDPAVNILDILVSYLNLTFKQALEGPVPAELPLIRKEILSLFLKFRCNEHGHLGVASPDNKPLNHITCSPFILCVKKQNLRPPPAAGTDGQATPCNQNIFVPITIHQNCPIESRCVNLDTMFAGIIECVNQETEAETLDTVLRGLPGLLANKPLVANASDERINQLCVSLSNLILVRRNTAHLMHCLRCLTTLLIYRKILDHKSIKMMLSVFEESIRAVSRHPIVPLFTTCLIKLQGNSEMIKFVPIVLDHLRRFSPTVNLGPSVLEFLSYLILFPKLHENFSQDEYKFIFSIALPYTNPFRFTDYITCLAFRVIAMWYLNCRPSLRCSFVEQVKSSLQSNVIQPFKENTVAPTQAAPHSHTSSPIISMSPVDQRKRSFSLNAENCYRNHQSSLQLNEELMEAFADLLSFYTHGQYLAIAPKNRCTELLIDRSTSQTWLNGNSLITVTGGKSNNGWAEILVRRPTGNTSWVGGLQNTAGTLPMFNQHSLNHGNDIVPLPKDKKFDIALSNLDLITPYETHKVGVIYVGKNQAENRAAILSNKFGSARYYEFLSHVGTCIILNDIDPEIYFIGGLDVKGEDGKYAYFWKDNVTQVIFHVATFMPARDNDPQCNNKNRHIGNDLVCIVFNDSGEHFRLSTIKGTGQLLKACLIISPLDEDTNVVEVEMLPELRNIVGDIEPRIHSNLGAALYARQMAIHLNLASKIFERRQCEGFFSKEPYVSNWVERLRCIKRIRQRLDESRKAASSNGSLAPRASNTLR